MIPTLDLYQKSILATVLLGIACMQLLVIATGRGWLGGFTFDTRRWMIRFHRFEGYAGLILILWVAYNCIYNIGVKMSSGRVAAHSLLGATVIGLVVSKIMITRGLKQFYTRLPVLGVVLFTAIIGLWFVSAGWYFFH